MVPPLELEMLRAGAKDDEEESTLSNTLMTKNVALEVKKRCTSRVVVLVSI